MNLSQLEYFDAAARLGSFARAAKALFVTPQTVSTAIAALEKEWGFPLFSREKAGIRLTPAGASMHRAAARVLAEVKDLEACASAAREKEHAAITFVYASASLPRSGGRLSAELLERFQQTHPNTALNVFELTADACTSAVSQRRADVAYAPAYSLPAELEGATLGYGESYVGMSRRNPLAAREEISFADLRDVEIFPPPDLGPSYMGIVEHCRVYGFEPHFSNVPFGVENARRFIRDDCGVSITPRYHAEHDKLAREGEVVYRPFVAEDDFKLPLLLIWRKGDAKGQSLREFILAQPDAPMA